MNAGSQAMAAGVRAIAALPDPSASCSRSQAATTASLIRKVRVPLGVVAVVYEARPNVTIDAAALCLKSGNAIVLRGSSSAAALQRRAERDRRTGRRIGRRAGGRDLQPRAAAAATSWRRLRPRPARSI